MDQFSTVRLNGSAALIAALLLGFSWCALADDQLTGKSDEKLTTDTVSPELFVPDEGMFVAISPNGAEAVLRSLADRRPHHVFELLMLLMEPDSIDLSAYISPLHESGVDTLMSAVVSPNHAHRLIDHAFTDDGAWAGVDEMLAIFEALGNEMANTGGGMLYTHVSFQPSRVGQTGRLRLDTYTEAICEVDQGPDARPRTKLNGPTLVDYRIEQMHPDFSSGPRQLAMIRLETLHLQDDTQQQPQE